MEVLAEDDGDAPVDDRLVEGGARQRLAARLQAEGRVRHRGELAGDERALAGRAVDGRAGLGGDVLDERVVAVVVDDVHAQPLADVGAAGRALVLLAGRRHRVARRARAAVQAGVGVQLDGGGVEHERAAVVALRLLRLAAPARVELLDDARALVGRREGELRHDDVGRPVVIGRAHLVGHDVQLAEERGALAVERAAGRVLARAYRAVGHEEGRVGVPHVVVEDVLGQLLVQCGALLRRARAHVRTAAVGGHVDEVRLERVAREVRVVLHGVVEPHLQVVLVVVAAVALLLAEREGRAVPPLVDRRARAHLLRPLVAQRHHVHARRLLHELKARRRGGLAALRPGLGRLAARRLAATRLGLAARERHGGTERGLAAAHPCRSRLVRRLRPVAQVDLRGRKEAAVRMAQPVRHRVPRLGARGVAEVVQIKEPRARAAERLCASNRVIVDSLELLGLHLVVLVRLGEGLGLDVGAQVKQVLRAREDALQEAEELLRAPELGLGVDEQLEAEGRLLGGRRVSAQLADEPALQLAHDALEVDRLVGQLAAACRVEHLLGGVQRGLRSGGADGDRGARRSCGCCAPGRGRGWGGEWQATGRAHLVIVREVDVGERVERLEQRLRAGTAGCHHKQPLAAFALVALEPVVGPVARVHDMLQRGKVGLHGVQGPRLRDVLQRRVRVVLSRRRVQPRRDLAQERVDETLAPGV